MKRQETVNTFSDGMILDLNPLSMPNNALTNCLNGTLLTYNGNENMLLNDMGNARVETAMLPTGYIPLGSTSFGGIIYIISYNPIEKKCQIGSFPSPERNLTKNELGDKSDCTIDLNAFTTGGWKTTPATYKKDENGNDTEIEETPELRYSTDTIISNYYLKRPLLKDIKLFSGDKFKVFSNNIINKKDFISSWDNINTNYNVNEYPKYLKLQIVSTMDNGKDIDLTDNLVWTVNPNTTNTDPYYIYNGDISKINENLDLDEYRGLVLSNYDVYSSKISGKLGIVAKLEVPTSFSVGYDIIKEKYNDENHYHFYFYLNWSNDNIGLHKNRINPSYIKVEYTEINIESEDSNESKKSKLYLIKLKKKNSEELILPNSLNNVDYCTLEIPDDFYSVDYDLTNYLNNRRNKWGLDSRKNDGTDFLYVLKVFSLVEKPDGKWYIYDNNDNISTQPLKVDNNIFTFDVKPVMPFGTLEFLNKEFSIDLSKIGTESIETALFQYYVDTKKIVIDLNFIVYAELGLRYTGCEIDLIPFSIEKKEEEKENIDPLLLLDTYEKIHNNDILIGKLPIEASHIVLNSFSSGAKTITLSRNPLTENNIYVIRYKIKYIKLGLEGYKFLYRLLFNNTVFNSKYQGNIDDFKDIYLSDVLIPIIKFDNSSNVLNEVVNDTSVIPNINTFERFLKVLLPQKRIEHIYNVTHIFDSPFTISTEMDSVLNLSADIDTIDDEDLLTEYSVNSDSELFTELNIYNKSITDFQISKSEDNVYHFKANSAYKTTIPYIVDYDDLLALKIYNQLNIRSNIGEVYLRGACTRKNGGSIWLDIGGNTEWSTTIPDESTGIIAQLNNVNSILYRYMQDNNYDYVEVIFGIDRVKNSSFGYRHYYSKDDNSYYYFKFAEKDRYNMYATINCMREDGGVRLVCVTRDKGSNPNRPEDPLSIPKCILNSTKEEISESNDSYYRVVYKNDKNKYESLKYGGSGGSSNSIRLITVDEEEIIQYEDLDSFYFTIEDNNFIFPNKLHELYSLNMDCWFDSKNSGQSIKIIIKYTEYSKEESSDITLKSQEKVFDYLIRATDWDRISLDCSDLLIEDSNKTRVLNQIMMQVSDLSSNNKITAAISNIFFYSNQINSLEDEPIIEDPEKKDYMWFTGAAETLNHTVIDSNYTKYVESGQYTNVYYVSNIEGPRNPKITTNYHTKLLLNLVKIKFKGTLIPNIVDVTNKEDLSVKNLHWRLTSNHDIKFSISSVINNNDWILEQMSLGYIMGIDRNNKVLDDNDLHKVYNNNYPDEKFILDRDNMVSLNHSNIYFPHDFGIFWEDAYESSNGKGAKQSYTIKTIYSINAK